MQDTPQTIKGKEGHGHRQKDGTQPSIDLGRINPLGALSQHRGANSPKGDGCSQTVRGARSSLLDQPIQGAGTPGLMQTTPIHTGAAGKTMPTQPPDLGV